MADPNDTMARRGAAGTPHEVRHPAPSSPVPGRRSRIRVLDIDTGRATVVHESAGTFYEAVSWPDETEALVATAGGVRWGIPVGPAEILRLGPPPTAPDTVDGVPDAPGGGRARVTLARVGACRLTDGTWISPRVVLVPGMVGGPDVPPARVRPAGASPVPPGTAIADRHGGAWVLFDAESDRPGQGCVQLFRMRPDGTGIEQLTHDERVNRFPQASPDGRLVACVSSPPGVEEGAVGVDSLLRLCTVDGSGGRNLVRLRGMRGAAVGHCWSPDSLRLACLDRPRADRTRRPGRAGGSPAAATRFSGVGRGGS